MRLPSGFCHGVPSPALESARLQKDNSWPLKHFENSFLAIDDERCRNGQGVLRLPSSFFFVTKQNQKPKNITTTTIALK